MMAWHTSMRSKGSLCRSGSLALANTAVSSSGSGSMRWRLRSSGTSTDSGRGNGSLPRPCLTAISHAETALRKTSLPGSAKSSRPVAESASSPVMIQRKVQCPATTSWFFALDGRHDVVGTRLEEPWRHAELPLGQTHGPPSSFGPREGSQLGDRCVPAASHHHFATRGRGQALREPGLGQQVFSKSLAPPLGAFPDGGARACVRQPARACDGA